MVSKRRRIALSCLECRRRRVKCDRTEPACIRCQKRGSANSCKYVPYEDLDEEAQDEKQLARSESVDIRKPSEETITSNSTNHVSKSTSNLPGVGAQQLDGLARSEQHPAGLDAEPESVRFGLPTPASAAMEQPSTASPSENSQQNLLRGKGFKTQFYGPSHYASILLRFPELTQFSKDVIIRLRAQRAKSNRIANGSKSLKRELDRKRAEQSHTHTALLQLLPERPIVDSHLQRYLDSFETTYRVLHIPTFTQAYESFWQAPQDASTFFICTLLLVMATVHCIASEEPLSFKGQSSVLREQATTWVTASEAWLDEQSQKHISLANFQIRILLFVAKRINAIKEKRAWRSAGELLRHAMDAGMHRNITPNAGAISVFDQEMRRRIWATILELELMAASDKGMSPSIRSSDWDCVSPRNIHDDEFGKDSTSLPLSKPYSEFTRTSWLCVSNQSASLRVDLLSRINAVNSAVTIEEATQYDRRIRQILSMLPHWQRNRQYLVDSSPHLAHHLLRLQLIEYIILIYQPLATSKEPVVQQVLSRAAVRDASARILEIYKSLEAAEDFTMRFFRYDSFRAALCLCFDLCVESDFSNQMTLNGERALDLLEHAFSIQETRVMALGFGQGFYTSWIMSSALSLACSKILPKQSHDQLVSTAAARVFNLHEKVQNLQENGLTREEREPQSNVVSPYSLSLGSSSAVISADFDNFSMSDTLLDFNTFDLADITGDFWEFNHT